jgi:transposase InsO family protein
LLPQHIAIPQRRFAHLHIDFVGPLHYSNNCNYVFTVIDLTSKRMEAVPLSDISMAACARALIFYWISPFGGPEAITSDCGPQFTSNVWSQLCKMLNITHCQMAAYHPEANGAVERLHCHLNDVLRARAAAATWDQE